MTKTYTRDPPPTRPAGVTDRRGHAGWGGRGATLKPESRDRTTYAIENVAAFKLADQPPRRKAWAYLDHPEGAMLATIVVLRGSTGAALYAALGYERVTFPDLEAEPMKAKKELSFDFPEHGEHELFRACIQAAVGIEQGHSREALAGYASKLREMARKHCYAPDFTLPDGTRLDSVSPNISWPR